jgi:hypothetical protein
MKAKTQIIVVGAATAAALLVPAVASAAPKADPNFSITVDCPGTIYDGPVQQARGDGQWTPAFVDHTTLIPVSFGPFTGTFTSPDGTFSFTDPPVVQNANKGGSNDRMECSYSIVGTEDGGTFQGTGSVVVAVVGKR